MAIKKKEKKERGTPAWMLTFGDLNSLLLTFFVMMFSVADLTGTDIQLILSAFRGSLGPLSGGQTLMKGRLEEMGLNIESLPSREVGHSLAKAKKMAEELLKPEVISKKVRIYEDERGIRILLTGEAFFDPGSAELKPYAKKVLKKIAKILNAIPNLIRIEGHTSKRPISPIRLDSRYPTNWELSAARAVNVLRYLQEFGNVKGYRMHAVGYGPYRPLGNNNTPEGRALNRRVEIVILKDLPKTLRKRSLEKSLVPGIEYSK